MFVSLPLQGAFIGDLVHQPSIAQRRRMRARDSEELPIPLRGAFDTVAVSREFLESAQAAVRGTKQKRNSADLAAAGESVVRRFHNRPGNGKGRQRSADG